MHEETLVRDLRRKVDQLAGEQPGASIVRARVALGALSHLDERRLRELWERSMEGSAAEGAVLEVELLPGMDDERAGSVVLRSVTFADPTHPSAERPPRPTPRPSSAPPR